MSYPSFLRRFRYPSLANDTFAQRRLRFSELYVTVEAERKLTFSFAVQDKGISFRVFRALF